MKKKSMVIFIVILTLVACVAYVAGFGLNVGNINITPFKDALELGLDLKGGVSVVLEAKTDETGEELQNKMEEAKLIMENRVNGLGVSEPYITIENGNRIRIELAGLNNAQEAIDMIGQTALLQFIDPDGNVVLTGKNVKEAKVVEYKGSVAVSLKFDGDGAKVFEECTRELINRKAADPAADTRISIVLDGVVQSAPSVNDVITNGESVITGSYTVDTAKNLAVAIQAGALPVDMEEVDVEVIGPTLGLESFDKSMKAGLIGVILIFIFMIIFYRVPGFIASIALTMYVIFEIGIMILLHAKLTLPGIAGMVLSVGMAVDANVVIFERIKEELGQGKTIRVAVRSGFQRALSAIIDANVTTLIAGLVLMQFGSGAIKGFAVTLIIGIIVSLLTAVIITRLLLNLIVDTQVFKSNKFFGAKEA